MFDMKLLFALQLREFFTLINRLLKLEAASCVTMDKSGGKKREFLKLIPTNFTHQTKEFFSNSTLHGVRYIAEKGLSFGEKFMWFSCVAVGAVAAFVIIFSLWEKFQTNPTITGIVLINLLMENSFRYLPLPFFCFAFLRCLLI